MAVFVILVIVNVISNKKDGKERLMKKILTTALIAIMCFTMFAGCGKKDAEADNTLYVYCFGDYFDPELSMNLKSRPDIR